MMSYAIPSFLTSQGDKNYLPPANFPYWGIIQITVSNTEFIKPGERNHPALVAVN